MSQTFIKIMNEEYGSSESFKLLTVEGNSTIEFTEKPRPLVYVNGVEHLVTGNVDIISESGSLISSFYPNIDQSEEPVFTVGATRLCRISHNRWLVFNDNITYIADSINVNGYPEITPDDTNSIENVPLSADLLRNRIGGTQFLALSDGADELILGNPQLLSNVKNFSILDADQTSVVDNQIVGTINGEPFAADVIAIGDYSKVSADGQLGIDAVYIPDIPAYSYLDGNFNNVVSVFNKNVSPYQREFGIIIAYA